VGVLAKYRLIEGDGEDVREALVESKGSGIVDVDAGGGCVAS
jgi:hypothetical protein